MEYIKCSVCSSRFFIRLYSAYTAGVMKVEEAALRCASCGEVTPDDVSKSKVIITLQDEEGKNEGRKPDPTDLETTE